VTAAPDSARAGPVILLSYAYSGAQEVQDALAAGTELGCTSGTGIIPQCEVAAQTWRQVEGHDRQAMSRLALATVRDLVTAQLTVILARTGKTRWCELATASPGMTEPFVQAFPGTAFVCVHRHCLDVVRAGVEASRWGLRGHGLAPYALSYPGNSAAALAAYWADSTQGLLAFEQANPDRAMRIRYEDVVSGPAEALTAARVWLGIKDSRSATFPEPEVRMPPSSAAEVPAEMIPGPLLRRLSQMQADLGYPFWPAPAPASPASGPPPGTGEFGPM
jgi:Sulfotransferase family